MSLTFGEIQDLVCYLGEDNNLPSSLAAVKQKLQNMLPTSLPERFERADPVSYLLYWNQGF